MSDISDRASNPMLLAMNTSVYLKIEMGSENYMSVCVHTEILKETVMNLGKI